MSWLRAILRFIYDFIIGDSWPVAAGVGAILAAGVASLRLGAVPGGALAVALGAAVVIAIPAIVLAEARAARPRDRR